ncbi:dihydroxyacetone kinase subunit DhaL [Parasphingorhabdus pacifica]
MSQVDALTTKDTLSWIDRYHGRIGDRVDEFTELDRAAGDGDFGDNIIGALDHARSALDTSEPNTPSEVFTVVSESFLGHSGGTSGALFGMWFRHFARATTPDLPLGTRELLAATTDGMAKIQSLGGAQVGDKTLVDALDPARQALEEAVRDGLPVTTAFERAAERAQSAAEATSGILASKGRASYVGEVGRGVADPGALAMALFYATGAESAR